MSYLGELRSKWRYLAGASLGLACGYLLNLYITSIFVPPLMAAFGWTKSQMSAVGAVSMLSLITMPLSGRITDAVGFRPVAIVGVIAVPLVFLAFNAMTGAFSLFIWLNVALIIFSGMTTSSVVYGRVLAEQFTLARGLAVAIAGSSPALAGALIAPFLSSIIAAHDWRAGYITLAIGTAIGGTVALLLIPRGPKPPQPVKVAGQPAASEFPVILRSATFRIIVFGLFVCNLSIAAISTQILVVVGDRGVTPELGALLVSLLAFGVVAGRFLCGAALDRFPSHIVIAVCLNIPGLALFVLASGARLPVLIIVAVSLFGLAMGAIVNLIPFLGMRYFRIEIFSRVIGMLSATVGFSQAIGALLLSYTLKLTGSFTEFLFLTAVAAIVGGTSQLVLGRPSIRDKIV
jgi:MFS family permease